MSIHSLGTQATDIDIALPVFSTPPSVTAAWHQKDALSYHAISRLS